MESQQFNSYISLLKSKSLTNNKLKNIIITFISENLTDNGYFKIDLTFNKNFILFLNNVVKLYPINNSQDLLNLINNNQNLFYHEENSEIMFYDFYFQLGLRISCMITTDLDYELISTIIFSIFNYGTTLETFESYYNFFKKDFKIDEDQYNKLLTISDYIKEKDETFKLYDLNSTSFKLLLSGHLNFKLFYNKIFIVENLDFLFARVAVELSNSYNLINIFESLKQCLISVSTPMFYHALREKKIFSSCFIINIDDNIDSIANSFKKLIKIQKYNSGVGLIYNKIRSSGEFANNNLVKTKGVTHFTNMSAISSENFKNLLRNRSSNININIGIENKDCLDFLKLKTSSFRKQNDNYNNLFQTISIPDEFMYRMLNNQPWYFISPNCSINGVHLNDVYGDEYSKLYNKMIEDESIKKDKISPFDILSEIHNSMIKTGGPFIFFKDSVNASSNHKNFGIIDGTNLCTEIFEYSNDKETAVCNLSSLNLKKFVNNKKFDFKLFEKQIRLLVNILNISIDSSFYSDKSCKKSNHSKRPIGIGIQGLAELFNEMEISYIEGKTLFQDITEFMYFIALDESNRLVINKEYKPFDNYEKTPIMEEFCFEMFEKHQLKKKNKLCEINNSKLSNNVGKNIKLNNNYLIHNSQWDELKKSIQRFGLANSLVLAFMPTSLSSGIYNNTESFEPRTHNIIRRQFSNYDCIVYNSYLVKYLLDNKLFTKKNIISVLMDSNNDLNNLKIPKNNLDYILKHFKTVYDFDTTEYIKFNSSVSKFIDQGKSTNLYVKDNNSLLIVKSIIDHWAQGSKSTYYYRIDIKSKAINCNSNLCLFEEEEEDDLKVCSLFNKDCIECSS